MEKLEWLNMYDKDKLNKWNDSDDIYFRFKHTIVLFIKVLVLKHPNQQSERIF
jgi:hypothetical protein